MNDKPMWQKMAEQLGAVLRTLGDVDDWEYFHVAENGIRRVDAQRCPGELRNRQEVFLNRCDLDRGHEGDCQFMSDATRHETLKISFQAYGPGETPVIRATVIADDHEHYQAMKKLLCKEADS